MQAADVLTGQRSAKFGAQPIKVPLLHHEDMVGPAKMPGGNADAGARLCAGRASLVAVDTIKDPLGREAALAILATDEQELHMFFGAALAAVVLYHLPLPVDTCPGLAHIRGPIDQPPNRQWAYHPRILPEWAEHPNPRAARVWYADERTPQDNNMARMLRLVQVILHQKRFILRGNMQDHIIRIAIILHPPQIGAPFDDDLLSPLLGYSHIPIIPFQQRVARLVCLWVLSSEPTEP